MVKITDGKSYEKSIPSIDALNYKHFKPRVVIKRI